MRMILDERDVESYLTERVEALGGQCIKHGQNGWPDRIVVLPGGYVIWCELKRPKGKHTAIQKYRKKILEKLGCTCAVCYTKAAVDGLLHAWSEV